MAGTLLVAFVFFWLVVAVVIMYLRLDAVTGYLKGGTIVESGPLTITNWSNCITNSCDATYSPSLGGKTAEVVYHGSVWPKNSLYMVQFDVPLFNKNVTAPITNAFVVSRSGQSDDNKRSLPYVEVTKIDTEAKTVTVQITPNSMTLHSFCVTLSLVYSLQSQ